MNPAPQPLTPAVCQAARRSVLCWLATVDALGQPNVAPKEVWHIADAQHVVVANIASPTSVRNIATAPQVCLSFAAEPIVAPSYWAYPDTTEAQQVASALRTYGVCASNAQE